MNRTVRVVLDTNVLVSALVGRGRPRKLLSRVMEEHELVVSPQMLGELADVISRDKFRWISEPRVNAFLAMVASRAILVRVEELPKVVAEDPDDDIVLATASQVRAGYIVSGDPHILKLGVYRGIRIVTVREMCVAMGIE